MKPVKCLQGIAGNPGYCCKKLKMCPTCGFNAEVFAHRMELVKTNGLSVNRQGLEFIRLESSHNAEDME